jgi:hypothetical protein
VLTYLRLLLQMSREKRRMWRNLSGSLLSATTWDPQRCAYLQSCYLMLAISMAVCLSLLASSYHIIENHRFELPCVRTIQFLMYCLLNSFHKKNKFAGCFVLVHLFP